MSWWSAELPVQAPETRELLLRLAQARVILDLDDPAVVEVLRRDVDRIAEEMEAGRPPLMLWTGIPFPAAPPGDLSSDYCLVISVGGTKTEYALLRLVHGEVRIVDREGLERGGDDAAEVKRSLRFPTPTQRETRGGLEMIERILEPIAAYIAPHRERLERRGNIVLSWGFASKVVRTGARVLGGLAALTTFMTKDQAAFTRDLLGKDLGALVRSHLEKRLGWSCPATVANDSIMALHYFLTAENLESHARCGLFINGTGTNFAAAEPYGVRPEGVVSRPGEEYEPRRITRRAPMAPAEREELFFVNYETGSLRLEATKTPFDVFEEHPIEENALSGGKAFEHQFREILRALVSTELHDRLLESWRRGAHRSDSPRGPEVSRMAGGGPEAVGALFPGARLSPSDLERIWVVCSAIVGRSALHAALILAAVTRRNDYGLGCRAEGKPDLLAMEGSVWSTRGYSGLVREAWQRLVGSEPLFVDFLQEKTFNASLPGPLYFAVLHQ